MLISNKYRNVSTTFLGIMQVMQLELCVIGPVKKNIRRKKR